MSCGRSAVTGLVMDIGRQPATAAAHLLEGGEGPKQRLVAPNWTALFVVTRSATDCGDAHGDSNKTMRVLPLESIWDALLGANATDQ